MRVYIQLVLLCAVLGVNAVAATYYVSTTGNNSDPGSQAFPWLTVQKAADTMVAGDTVIVANGNYAEKVTTAASGTQGSPIRFEASGASIGGFYVKHAFQQIVGFVMNGTNVTGYNGVIHIDAEGDNGNNLLVQSNTLHTTFSDIYLVANYGSPTNVILGGNRFQESLYQLVAISGSGHTITNNYFSSTNGGDALRLLASNTRVAGNIMTNVSNLVGSANHTDCIQTFTTGGFIATNNVIENNLFINCAECQMGNFEDQDGSGPLIADWTWRNNVWANVGGAMFIYGYRWSFYNNTIYRSGTNTGSALLFRQTADRGTAHSGTAMNNIFVECGSYPASADYGWYGVDASCTNFTGDYNFAVGVGGGFTKNLAVSGREAHGVTGQDPRLLSPSTFNFGLMAGSPCIGTATNLSSLFVTDLTGKIRGNAWDIGAYKYLAGIAAPVKVKGKARFK